MVSIGLKALRKLGVKADVGKEARAQGRSAQMPMAPIISVGKSRVRMSFGNAIGRLRFVSRFCAGPCLLTEWSQKATIVASNSHRPQGVDHERDFNDQAGPRRFEKFLDG